MLFRRARHQLRCRDTERATHLLTIAVHLDHRGGLQVALGVDDLPPLPLAPLQVGQLRAELRDAVLVGAHLAADVAEQAERERVTL